MNQKSVTILCSGVALGVYIPAILADYQLRRRGVSTQVTVLENLFLDNKKVRIGDNKKAFHKDFRFALMGQKMAFDLRPYCGREEVQKLFENWEREMRRNFIVFSGFWMPVLKEYEKLIGVKINADLVHMDAGISASWKHFQEESVRFNNIWLFDWKEKRLRYEIPVTGTKPVPYHKRPERYVIHGGGWGMGTYLNKIPELENKGISLDIVAYDLSEAEGHKKGNRCFMIDPGWAPWKKNGENLHEFPPFGEIRKGESNLFKNRPEYHEIFDLINNSRAVISKPGGATLLDSLASATPLVMLEPFGDYERKNAELWEHLGFGIQYDRWKECGYPAEILECLHNNLLEKKGKQIDFVSDYINREMMLKWGMNIPRKVKYAAENGS